MNIRDEAWYLHQALETILNQFGDQVIVNDPLSLGHNSLLYTARQYTSNRVPRNNRRPTLRWYLGVISTDVTTVVRRVKQKCKDSQILGTSNSDYLTFIHDAHQRLGILLKLPQDVNQLRIFSDDIKAITFSLMQKQFFEKFTFHFNRKEYTLTGLINNTRSKELLPMLRKLIVQREVTPEFSVQLKHSKRSDELFEDNLVVIDKIKLPNDVIVKIFRYLSLQELSNASLVCRRFNEVFHLKSQWQERLRLTFGLSRLQCLRLGSPMEVFRRLHWLSNYTVLDHSSNQAITHHHINPLSYWKQIQFLMKDDQVDVTDYPELFYPFTPESSRIFDEKLSNFTASEKSFLLSQSCFMGNKTLIELLSSQEVPLPLSLLFAAVSTSTVDFLIGCLSYVHDNFIPELFGCVVFAGNYEVAHYLWKSKGKSVNERNVSRIVKQFGAAIRAGNVKLLRLLRDKIYPDFDLNQRVNCWRANCDCTEFSAKDVMLYYGKKLYIENIQTIFDILRVNVSELSEPVFARLFYNETNLPMIQYLLSERGCSLEDLPNICFYGGHTNETLVALHEVNNKIYETEEELNQEVLNNIRCLFAVIRDDLARLRMVIESLPQGVEVDRYQLCLASLVSHRVEILAYLLSLKPSLQVDATMVNYAASRASVPLFQVLLDNHPHLTLPDKALRYLCEGYNLRLARYLFEKRNVQLPENWRTRFPQISARVYMDEYISESRMMA